MATPIGEIKYGERLYFDWKKCSDGIVSDRRDCKKMAASAQEALGQGNQMALINICENAKREICGFVNTVEYGMAAEPFFVKDVKRLNNARKG